MIYQVGDYVSINLHNIRNSLKKQQNFSSQLSASFEQKQQWPALIISLKEHNAYEVKPYGYGSLSVKIPADKILGSYEPRKKKQQYEIPKSDKKYRKAIKIVDHQIGKQLKTQQSNIGFNNADKRQLKTINYAANTWKHLVAQAIRIGFITTKPTTHQHVSPQIAYKLQAISLSKKILRMLSFSQATEFKHQGSNQNTHGSLKDKPEGKSRNLEAVNWVGRVLNKLNIEELIACGLLPELSKTLQSQKINNLQSPLSQVLKSLIADQEKALEDYLSDDSFFNQVRYQFIQECKAIYL